MKKEKHIRIKNISLSQFLKYCLFAIAVSSLVIYLWVAISRMQYPFELEWIEGGMTQQVQRLVNGQSIYVAPSIDFVPFLYPPVYFYLSAAVSSLLGSGMFPLRLVSFVASLISFMTIFLIVRDETKNWWVALLSTGLFAASFRVTGAWLDIARVDSLFLAFLLLVVYFVKGRMSLVTSFLAGIFAAAAFLTKQSAFIVCLPILLFLLWRNWKFALLFLAIEILVIGTTTLVLEVSSGGWYSYYVFGLLSQQTQWLLGEFFTFWKDDLLVHIPFAILFTLFFLGTKLKQDRQSMFQWLSILTGALACSFITRVKIGGYDNVLLTTYAVLSILFGLGLSEFITYINQLHEIHIKKLEIMIQIACLIQFVILMYNPFTQIPTKADLDAGNNFVQFLSNVDGEVYLPDHGYLLTLAGRKTYAHHSAIWDVLRTSQQNPVKAMLLDDLDTAIRQQVFDMIILDSGGNYCCREIEQFYTKGGDVFQDDATFFPVTGDKRRPTYIYIANRLK
jgi:4-amino-4-deoxy-L-arabinose transferase-like glycosyltransferase